MPSERFPGATDVEDGYTVDGSFCPVDDSPLYVVAQPDFAADHCRSCDILYEPRSTDESRKKTVREYVPRAEARAEQLEREASQLRRVVEAARERGLD